MDEDKEYEKAKPKGHLIAITTLSILGVIVLFMIVAITAITFFFEDFSKTTYYVLEVNEKNKEQILSLLEQENKRSCESIYKIEYTQLFPDDKSAKIYCLDEKDITFGIYDENPSALADYIQENGRIEKR